MVTLFDSILLTSQLIDKDLLQTQGQGLQHHRLELFQPACDVLGRTAHNVGIHPAHVGGVEHLHLSGQDRHLAGAPDGLELDNVLLEIRQAPLQQDLPLVHDAYVVAHILQLPQVVGADQHGGAVLADVAHHQAPHLPAHDGIQAVHRLVKDQVLGPAAHGQPEGGLLLHPLAHAADGGFFRQGEDILELLIAGGVKGGVEALVEVHHIPDGGGGEVVPIVGDGGHQGLFPRVFIHALPLHQDLAAVGTVDAGKMADDGGFARAVGAYQAVYPAVGHCNVRAVQGAKAVEGLDQTLYLDHCPTSSLISAMISLSGTRRYRSSAISSRSWASSSVRLASSASRVWEAKLPLPGTE